MVLLSLKRGGSSSSKATTTVDEETLLGIQMNAEGMEFSKRFPFIDFLKP